MIPSVEESFDRPSKRNPAQWFTGTPFDALTDLGFVVIESEPSSPCDSSRATEEHIGSDHDYNLVVLFGDKTTGVSYGSQVPCVFACSASVFPLLSCCPSGSTWASQFGPGCFGFCCLVGELLCSSTFFSSLMFISVSFSIPLPARFFSPGFGRSLAVSRLPIHVLLQAAFGLLVSPFLLVVVGGWFGL
ncbi:hypothetical protein M5K25_001994 [Dendrobium thyrsiflorum]|uniref:Uncharacterized protein n=1 Tax=Dendrobium thyrsiflorum TaxID=117978 RepID=A0ABD0VRW4_DENTH